MIKFRLGLIPRITLVFVLFAAVLLAGVEWFSYEKGRSALQASTTSELLSAAIQKETELNGWVDERMADLTGLAGSPALREDVNRLVNAPASPAGREAHDRLVANLRPSVGYQLLELFVLHPLSGKVLASTSPAQEGKSKKTDPYFVNGVNGSYVKNPYQSATLKAPGMTMSTPLRVDGGLLLGVLVARLDLKALNAIVGQRTGVRRTDDAYLINPASQFVTQPRFIAEPVALKRIVHTEATKLCLQGNSGILTAPDYRGRNAIIVYRWLPTRRLGLILKVEQAEALAPVYAFRRTILLISGLALLLATGLAIGLARGISQPIRTLQSGVARFGQGESDLRLPENSDDEVGLLAREFNQMALTISAKEAQLHASEQRSRLLVEGVQDYAILMLDVQGRVATWNVGAQRLKGYAAEEIIGQHFSRFYPPEDVAAGKLERELEGATRDGRFEDEGWRVRKDGTRFWANVVITALRDEGGELRGFSKITRDITERKRAEDEIRQLNEDLEQRVEQRTAELEAAKAEVEQAARANRNMMEYSQDVICSIDEAGRFISVSPACREVWGYSPEELSGRLYIEMVHPDDVEKTNRAAADIMNGYAKDSFENRYLRRDGSSVDMLWSAVWSDAEKSMFCVARDITERKRDEENLRAAKKAAEEASIAKSQFLANMSHEIRTPMNGVLGPIGLLLDSKLSGQQRELTEIARSSAELLLGIINDILDLSKIEVGKLDIEPIPFDLLLAVEETAGMMAAKAEEKDIDIIVRYPIDVPRFVVGDPGRIRQVLANLVSNAIKFTPQGHILIDVEVDTEADTNEKVSALAPAQRAPGTRNSTVPPNEVRLRFNVQDTGIGIAPDKIEHVFGRFNQADTSTTRRYGGTGLGLSISRQLVELMGGEIGATSAVGEGSTFSFTLRLPLQPAAPAFSLPDADMSGVRILIVDDNAVNRRVLHEQLNNWSLRNESAPTGVEALEMLRAAKTEGDPFQIAILDHQMPDMDGETLGRTIKVDASLQDTILLMLTSLGNKGDAIRLKTAGFAAYLLKPARQSELLSALINVWAARNSHTSPQLVTRHSIAEAGPARQDTPRRWEGTRVLVAEDNIVNQKVATMILQSFGCRVEVAANGREALKSIEAFPFDIIFMDCEMPEMDGYEATAEIRLRTDDKRRLPIVAVTAKATRGDREFCLQSGMDDYISKPVKSEDFQAALERWAPRGKEEGAPIHANPDAEPFVTGTVEFDRTPVATSLDAEVVARLRDLAAATDASLLAQIFESFVSDGEARIGTLRRALEKNDAVVLHKAAHALKGASANIGARRMADIAEQLQAMGEAGSVEGAEAAVDELDQEFGKVRMEIVGLMGE
jgi:PAS domain S-box-containing protein